MDSDRVLNFWVSLDRVDIALSVSVSALTIPRDLAAVPAPMVTDCDGGARLFADSRDIDSVIDVVSVMARILACILATASAIVMVSVRLLTIFWTPDLV